jgi:hypothetical protein
MTYARKYWDSADYRVGLEIAADTSLPWAEVAAEMTARGRPPRSARAVANALRKAGTPPRVTETESAPLFPPPASAPAALPDAVAAFVAHVRATARAEVFTAIRAALAEIEAAP